MNPNSAKNILIVEDEPDLASILQFNLEREGYTVTTESSAEEALHHDLETFHLFILDVMLGDMSGFSLASVIRETKGIKKPIIFITAKDKEEDKLRGFGLGADDYIPKPFSVKEVLARVNAVIKRYESANSNELTGIALPFSLDVQKRRVITEDGYIDLTPKEFEILKLLAGESGRVFPRESILNIIWKNDVVVTVRTVDVNIARLRSKLGKWGRCIKNKSGAGYFFEL